MMFTTQRPVKGSCEKPCRHFSPRLVSEAALDWAGAFVMRWGKHEGKCLDELDTGYLSWLAGECRDEELKALAAEVLAQRAAVEDGQDEGDPFRTGVPSDEPARLVLPILVFDFEQQLRAAYGEPAPDTPAAAAVALAVVILRAIASVYTGRCRPTADQVAEAVKKAVG
jgi:hypothetical protein